MRVYWTDDEVWYHGVVSVVRNGDTFIYYDAVGAWGVTKMWHTLSSERWEFEPPVGQP